MHILVTNDDGVGADGIDALVQGLSGVPGVEVTVVAPATNQSGKGGAVTGGTLTATQTTTKSGHPATAVDGTPGRHHRVGDRPEGGRLHPRPGDLGDQRRSEPGAGDGPLGDRRAPPGPRSSGASRRWPPARAQLTPPQDFPSGVSEVLAWLDANLPAVRAGTLTTGSVANLNVPTCTTGSVRGEVQVPVATSMDGYTDQPDCASTATTRPTTSPRSSTATPPSRR